MKAIVLKKHGDLQDVVYGDVPTPKPGPGEVLLEVKAAALNRLDLWVTKGWRGLKLTFPHIMGCDGSGIVAEIGPDIVGFAPGDRVAINPTRSCGSCEYCLNGQDNLCDDFALFGEHIPGFYAEYQVVPVRNLLLMPDSVSFEDAAAASLVYVTAWHSLIEVGCFRAGEDLLVIGAGGGVNTACIDVARLAGARTIYVVGSDDRTLDLARQLGAHVTINRRDVDWGQAVYEASQRQGVDVVVDNVGAATFPTSLRSLKKGGRLLTVGNTSGPVVELDNRYIFGKHLQIIGTTMGPISAYRKVMRLIFEGRLSPAIDTIYPLSDGLQALQHLARGRTLGKLVIKP
ncbi:MAG: zinc-binding dehydrogenase [Chloroflexota bacterium]|nr:MAG: zinc-binding dehydrogenase [Chloroflexota bacterium]